MMSETTTISASDVLCNLKAVVADLECQQKQQIFKQLQEQLQRERQLQKHREKQQEQINKSPAQPPMFLMIPIEDTQKCETDKRCHTSGHTSGHDHENGCSKASTRDQGKTRTGNDKKTHRDDPALELKGIKSRELRAGILYTGCACLHRDGLQDNCPRSACQGQPECLVKPWAVCPPGILCRSRHPELFGAPPNPDALTY